MRYMFLVYSRETGMAESSAEDILAVRAGHWAVINETKKRGLFCAGEPLRPTAMATTIRMEGGKPLILDGPFAETKELIGGYWIINVKSRQEALDWAKRAPAPFGEMEDGEIELRQFYEMEDFLPSEALDRAKEIEQELAKTRKQSH